MRRGVVALAAENFDDPSTGWFSDFPGKSEKIAAVADAQWLCNETATERPKGKGIKPEWPPHLQTSMAAASLKCTSQTCGVSDWGGAVNTTDAASSFVKSVKVTPFNTMNSSSAQFASTT